MPLKANLKKKTEQEKEQSYTKPKNNVSLPKKTVTTAKQSAQAIKSSVSGKKTYKPSAKKEQEVKNRIATKKNYGSEKSDTSYRNTRLGKTSSYTAQSSYKKGREAVKQKAEDTGLYVNKVDTTTPRKKKENTNPTRGNGRDTSQRKQTNRNNYNKHKLDEGAKDIQNRALSGQLNVDEPTRYITDVHGRTAVDDRVRVNNLDDWFNVGGKFLSNAMDSTIDYSPLGTAYTLASGETLTNGAYYDNPYEEQRQQGLSAGAGRMAGMALNYGIARSAANPLLEQAANAVMNGTKVGALINNSATLGKIGQAVGTNTAKDIASGLVKETISDATIGAGQNALINYAEGLRGEDFWRQMAKDEALDFAIGGIMEGVGIGRQIGNLNKATDNIINENPASMLSENITKQDYLNDLWQRMRERMSTHNTEGNASKLRDAAYNKIDDLLAEHNKVVDMTDEQFARYRQGLPTDEPVEEVAEETAKETSKSANKRVNAKQRNLNAKSRYNAYGERLNEVEEATINATNKGETKVHEGETQKAKTETTATRKPQKNKKTEGKQVDMELEPKAEEPKGKETKQEVSKQEPNKPKKPATKPQEKAVKKAEPKVEEPEAKVETPQKHKAELKVREKNKGVIVQKMRDAGVELPDNVDDLTEKELRALNDGSLSLEDAKKIDHKKTSKKKQINLDEYDKIDIQTNKSDAEIKDELIRKYIDNKSKLGEPLSESEIENLKGMKDAKSVRDVIDKDAVERSNYKTLDEYYDNTLFKKENNNPELVRKSHTEEGSLKSEQLRKGSDDAYTRKDAPETDPYFGTEVRKKEMPLTKAEKEVIDTVERHLKLDSHPTAKRISQMTDVDEATVRKILDDKGFELRGDNGNVYAKETTASNTYTTTVDGGDYSTTTSGGTYTATTTNDLPKKSLPKRMSKGHTEAALQRRYEKAQSLDELTKSNRSKPNKVTLDTNRVDDIKIDTGDVRTSLETGTPKEKTKKEKATGLFKKFRRDVIDSSDELRRIDKETGKTTLQEKYKMSQGSRAQSAHQLINKITNRNGEALKFKDSDGKTVTKSFRDIFEPFKKNMDDINLYMFNKHEIERALQSNSNAMSLSIYGYSKEEADSAAKAVINVFPELKQQKDALAKWLADGMQNDSTYREFKKNFDGFGNVVQKLNQIKSEQAKKTVEALENKYGKKTLEKLSKDWKEAYEKWFDDWAVKSGLVDKDLVKEWRGRYHNYIPSFRVKEVGSGAMSVLDSPELFHSIRGKSEAKLLGVEDQIGIMINRITSASRRNELNLSIYNVIKDNPNKGFGKIISSSDEAIGDIDEALKIVGGSASDIINGSKKITVLADGKKVTMEISEDLAATLRAMQDGADTGIMTRVGKWITNPIKLGITGANPTFVVSNAVRDMATALIQSEHGMHKTVAGWGKAIAGMTGINKEYAELLQRYKFAGGESAGYYVQGKGFSTSAILHQKGVKGMLNKVGEVLTFLGEQGETIPRFGEFLNTMAKTGDFEKAVRDAAEVTVDFSKKGASDGVKLLDAWTLYLNAGLQGIDKFAKTLMEHPVRTTGRTALIVGTPAMALLAINHDNPWYQDLSDRTRQNYFCIPKFDGEKDEEGNCKEFIRLPMNREYGAILGAGLDCIWRTIKGEENPTSGFATTLSENFLPNDPIRDNVLAPLLINIPSNKDYKGAKILTTSEFEDFKAGKNADLQYDASTSGTAMSISKLANKLMGDKNVPILKYLKSPKLVDYVLDSYGGYYGQVAQSATQQGVENAGDIAKNVLLKPYADKFTTDSRYSSKSLSESWDILAEYKAEKKRAESEGQTWSEAHAKYEAVDTIMSSIYDSMDAEKAIKSDTSLSDKEKKQMIDELREARVELAKSIDSEVKAASREYKESPTYSSLKPEAKEKYSASLGMTKESWAKAYRHVTDTAHERYTETGSYATAEEKRMLLLEQGVTSYNVAKSILGDSLSEKTWNKAKEAYKNGQNYDDLVRYNLDKEERQKNMTETEKKFDDYFRTRSDTRYDGKSVSKDMYDKFLYEVEYVDKNTNNNGSITKAEAKNAIENLDQMYGLTQAQKAYLWYLAENDGGWKEQPYGKWNG